MKLTCLLLSAMLLTCAAPAQDKLDLRLRFTKGEIHQMNLVLQQTIDQTVQGVPQRTTQTLSIGYSFTVEEINAQGKASIAVRYDSIALECNSPAGDVRYASTRPAVTVPPMAGGISALIGRGYSVEVSAAGRVEKINGLDSLLKAVTAKLNVPDGAARAAAEKMLTQQLDEENVKSQLQRIFVPFADQPVAVGESWYRKTPLSLAIPLTQETTYALKSRDNGMATVEFAGRSSTTAGAMVDMGQYKLAYDLHGDMHGELRIQESTGWAQSFTTTQHLSGAATFRAPNTPPQTVPITIDSTLKTQMDTTK